jgi:Protein kinase domain
LTQSGVVAGTPQYMAPEQARGDLIDARSDLFSLGSVLYAMCAGRPPFRASTTMGVLKRVSEDPARPVREVNPEVPVPLAEIIARLHAKDPAERLQTAAEVAEMLGRQLARLQQPGLAAGVRTELAPITPQAAAPRSGALFRSRRWVGVAAVLAILAGLFVASESSGVTAVTQFVATVLRIHTPNGMIVVETDDPDVQVTVDGEDVAIAGAGPKEIRVRPGEHRIAATKDGKEWASDTIVTVTRGGKQIVKISQENPHPPNAAAGRLDTLRKILAQAEALYKLGRVSAEDLAKAQLAVLDAELSASESAQERIGICEKILSVRRDTEKRMEQLYKVGRITQIDLLQARQERQEAEERLSRERAKKATR